MAVFYRGNQLFQIASTIGVATYRRDEVSFPPWDYAPFFSIPGQCFSGEPGRDVTTLVPHLPPAVAPYLQDYGLFSRAAPRVREWLQPSTLAHEQLSQYETFRKLEKPILSVHVRRGDNVPGADPGVRDKHLYHPMPPLDYYKRAIKMYAGSYASIAVFGDDWSWNIRNVPGDYHHTGQPRTKEHLPGYATEPFSDWVDLFLQAECQYHIVSNSTFGWWGAFLANDPSPIVPRPWFGLRVTANAELMFPPGWRQLETGC